MKNQYHKDIIDLLIKQGKSGLSVGSIAQSIYNEHADFFADDVRYKKIHNAVQNYLWRQSKQRRSPFKRIGWGRYAIKPDFAVQLDFILEMFDDEEETETIHSPSAIQLDFTHLLF
ncbi:MAG: hypothetical protein HUK02_02295 [Bacteroidaceae bacterium]|nr:hypothetical protein [Bacteroidaceae bacterium]